MKFPVRKLLLSAITLALAVLVISLYWRQNLIVFLFLGAGLIFLLVRAREISTVLIPCLVGGIMGPLMEAIAIHAGAWQYANPTVIGIPYWLPLLWGLVAVFLVKITRWLTTA